MSLIIMESNLPLNILQCDTKRPSCSQCIRVQTTCYGYRDQLSLMFKNESDTVATKAQKRYGQLSKQKIRQSTRKERAEEIAHVPSASWSSDPSDPASWNGPTPPLALPVESQALAFFLSQHKIEPSIFRGQFEFLPGMLSQNNIERILQSSVNAVSLASLAINTKSAHIMNRAREEYGAALKITNSALRSRDTAIKDTTLIAIILLSMYENFVCEDAEPLKAMWKHIVGASTLLLLRGTEGVFSSNIGMSTFQQFYSYALPVAIHMRSPISKAMAELWSQLAASCNASVATRQWYAISSSALNWNYPSNTSRGPYLERSVRIVRFIYNCSQLDLDKSSGPDKMVTRAMELAQEFDSLTTLTPSSWEYEAVHVEQGSMNVFGNYYLIHTDQWLVQKWNHVRSARLRLGTILREQLPKALEQFPMLFTAEKTQRQLVASEVASQKAIADICASVPQIIGQIAFPEPSASLLERMTSDAASDPLPKLFDLQQKKYKLHAPGTFLDPSRPTGMSHLVFPICAAAQYEHAPSGLIQWAIDQLHFIARTVGTRQPLIFADELKLKLRGGSSNNFGKA
jgi:hypothetical protein